MQLTLKQLHAVSLLGALAFAGGCAADDTDAETSDTDSPTTTTDAPTTGVEPTGGPTTDMPTTDDSVDSSGTDDTTSEAEALIRVIHGSPLSPAVDVYVAGTSDPVISGLEYGTASEYLPVPPGDYVFDIRAAGAGADEDPAFTTDVLTLEADVQVSALAAGLLGGSDEDGFRVLPLVEGFEDPGAGNAAVRVVHAGSDAPSVSIDVGNDGSSELEDVARFADSGAAGVALPADTELQIGIVAGGETVTAFTTPALPEGAELFVIATGLLGELPREDSGFSLLAVSSAGSLPAIRQNPRVYAAHLGVDAPNVDICTGDALLLGDVPFGAMGGVQVPPGEYPLDVYAAGDGCDGTTAAGSSTTPALAAGEQYLAIATGELTPENDDPAFSIEYFAEAFDTETDPADAGLRIIHGASAPAVNIGTLTAADDAVIEADNAIVTGLSWPQETPEEVVLPEGNYFVGVGAASDQQPRYDVLASFTVPAPAGFRGWVIAGGALAPDGEEPGLALYAVATAPGPWTFIGPIAPNGG